MELLPRERKIDIERVQKTALHVMLGGLYQSYGDALDLVGLETLDARRQNLCLKFAKKAVKHEKHTNWFVPNNITVHTIQYVLKFDAG